MLSFQTVAEVRFGALLRGWGPARLRRLDVAIAGAEIVHSGLDLIRVYAELRVACERIGHAPCQRENELARSELLGCGAASHQASRRGRSLTSDAPSCWAGQSDARTSSATMAVTVLRSRPETSAS